MKQTRSFQPLAVALFFALILIVACSAGHRAHAAVFSFQGLGDFPGGAFESRANAISADGSTIVGESQDASRMQAFRWTRDEGLVSLGLLEGYTNSSYAYDVSADGSVIGGAARNLATGYHAYKWTAGTGMVSLPTATPGISYAFAVSGDGQILGGTAEYKASLWTQGGMSQALNFPQPDLNNNAVLALTPDASVAVGTFGTEFGYRPFRWSANSGMVELPLLPGHKNGGAQDVSADGSVVVGTSTIDINFEAVRWTEAEGAVGLGGRTGVAYAVSADGSVIGGQGFDGAFVWTKEAGYQVAKDLLLGAGLNQLQGWYLYDVSGISADGLTITGTGFNPQRQYEAWVATIPEPSTYALAAIGVAGLLAFRRLRR